MDGGGGEAASCTAPRGHAGMREDWHSVCEPLAGAASHKRCAYRSRTKGPFGVLFSQSSIVLHFEFCCLGFVVGVGFETPKELTERAPERRQPLLYPFSHDDDASDLSFGRQAGHEDTGAPPFSPLAPRQPSPPRTRLHARRPKTFHSRHTTSAPSPARAPRIFPPAAHRTVLRPRAPTHSSPLRTPPFLSSPFFSSPARLPPSTDQDSLLRLPPFHSSPLRLPSLSSDQNFGRPRVRGRGARGRQAGQPLPHRHSGRGAAHTRRRKLATHRTGGTGECTPEFIRQGEGEAGLWGGKGKGNVAW